MRPLRIFLVENHEDTVKYLKLYLEFSGHAVLTAPDMATALSQIPEAHCDVLISDIGLPDGDGWVLLEKLESNRPRFAIAISGYGTESDRQKSHSVGYDRHLVKPFSPDTLREVLEEAAKQTP
jgi:DNA-binding response OmpR family regulator